MSASIHETGYDIPLESREKPAAPIPFTRNLNNDMTNPVISDMRIEGDHIPGMVKESTVWDVYNNEARKVDNELVKDWTASLNFLLVFAAIFAAVLTAFIIESKKMLEQDQTQVLVDIAIQYFNNIGNQSRNNLTRPNFEPTFEAISINCLLFASLGASLVAALASVVALQWVADYDAAITRGGSSPLDRAKRRQFRFAGVTRWKMGELIAALPLLLYSSVVLFWAGAIQWMWSLHHTVGYVVAGGTAIAVLFYTSTTLLGAVFLSSLFRTPLSRGFYWLPLWLLSLVGRFLLWLPIESAFRFSSTLYQTISSHIRALIVSDPRWEDRDTSLPSLSPLPSLNSAPARLHPFEAISKWIKIHLTTIDTSRQREDEAAKQDPVVEQEALAWLAQQLPISDDAHERLLLCISGIPLLSTENALSPRFHDAPWLAILDVLSERFLRQIFDPTSSEKDYQGVGILLQVINSTFICNKVVPPSTHLRYPGFLSYWTQFCLVKYGVLDFGPIKQAPAAFLLARDVPIPSLSSKHELETTWNLIKWRNSVNFISERSGHAIWLEAFGDIGRYSPEVFESCLYHFRTWTNMLWVDGSSQLDHTVMFDSIVQQALHRDLTIGEALALVRAFSGYITAAQRYDLPELDDETNIIPQPLSYTRVVRRSESTLETHLAITLILIRAARSPVRAEQQRCAKWITLMLWICIPNESGSLNISQVDSTGDSEAKLTRDIWDEIEMSSKGVAVQGAPIEEIGRALWDAKNAVMESLIMDAFKDPLRLRYLELLLQWIPHCDHHHTGSQHILIHLNQSIQYGLQKGPYCIFRTTPVHVESIEWTTELCNPILAMLALPDTQDLTCLTFSGVDLECARHILGIVKAVKTRPAEFLCLLADIIIGGMWGTSPTSPALLLESIKQAMAFPDEEPITSFLHPLALGLQERLRWSYVLRKDSKHGDIVMEGERVCHLLQAKYASNLISLTMQLRMLSCTRSAAVEQPATGWLRMHMPL